MKAAAIDVGSNTVRMLVAEVKDGQISAPRYYRRVTRLAGRYDPATGLHHESMAQTLVALEEFHQILIDGGINQVHAVGTAALRLASNTPDFLEQLDNLTGITLEVIDGETEACLSSRGILSVLDPIPRRALLFDIGGGSTEFVLYQDDVIFQDSLQLGAVRLKESYPDKGSRLKYIQKELSKFFRNPDWQAWREEGTPVTLVGTAGTITTLAAIRLNLSPYDGSKVNNLKLSRTWVSEIEARLAGLTPEQRLEIVGMEPGREDIIHAGTQLLGQIISLSGQGEVLVADAGILEGILLEKVTFRYLGSN